MSTESDIFRVFIQLISLISLITQSFVNRGFNAQFVCYIFQFVCVAFAGRRRRPIAVAI